MPGQPVISGASFAAGLLSQALGTYRRMWESNRERLRRMMNLDVPSTRREELHFYWEAAPHIVRWPRGANMSSKPFRGVQYKALNHRWARAIEWNNEDLQDDQTGSLMMQARGLGQSMAALDERIHFQLMLGTVNADLLPEIPNAPDTNAFFFGDANSRFGASGGNLFGATFPPRAGIATSAAIRQDYWNCLEQFRLFQDTEGEPLFDAGQVDGDKIVIFPAENEEVFREAFTQTRTIDGSVQVTNVVQEANQLPTLWPTQRLSGTDWYTFLASTEVKATFSQLRESIREVVATMENSDIARETGVESIRFLSRKGASLNLPYQAIKVDNA